MRWKHSHSWAAGILTGILISQRAIYLILFGIILGVLFFKLGTLYRMVMLRLSRRWTIRS